MFSVPHFIVGMYQSISVLDPTVRLSSSRQKVVSCLAGDAVLDADAFGVERNIDGGRQNRGTADSALRTGHSGGDAGEDPDFRGQVAGVRLRGVPHWRD